MLRIIRRKRNKLKIFFLIESLPDNSARANVALIHFVRHVFQIISIIKFCSLAIVAVKKNSTFLWNFKNLTYNNVIIIYCLVVNGLIWGRNFVRGYVNFLKRETRTPWTWNREDPDLSQSPNAFQNVAAISVQAGSENQLRRLAQSW